MSIINNHMITILDIKIILTTPFIEPQATFGRSPRSIWVLSCITTYT